MVVYICLVSLNVCICIEHTFVYRPLSCLKQSCNWFVLCEIVLSPQSCSPNTSSTYRLSDMQCFSCTLFLFFSYAHPSSQHEVDVFPWQQTSLMADWSIFSIRRGESVPLGVRCAADCVIAHILPLSPFSHPPLPFVYLRACVLRLQLSCSLLCLKL